jgi:hypothetical protein
VVEGVIRSSTIGNKWVVTSSGRSKGIGKTEEDGLRVVWEKGK